MTRTANSGFRRHALASLAMMLAWCISGAAHAQGAPHSMQRGKVAPGMSDAQIRHAKDLLEQAAKAMAKLKAFSYVAHAETLAPASSTYSAEVCGQFIEAREGAHGFSGWKLRSEGSVSGAAASSAGDAQARKKFLVANDGAASRSIVDTEKTVLERADDTIGGVFSFFANFAPDAHETVFWEYLTSDALIRNQEFNTVTSLEAPQTIDGKICDAVFFGAAKPSPDEPKPDGKMQAGSADASSGMTYVKRIFIARDDHLPRRIERLHVDTDGRTVTGRILEVRSLHVDDNARLAPFTLEAPDGYRIRAAKLTRSAQTGTADNKAPAAPPLQGLTWRHDRKLLKAGADAPAFSLKDTEGKTHTLADFKGKVVVLDFWATWCPPCRAVMPSFQSLSEKYKDKNVVIIGMNAEMGQGNGDPGKFKKDNGYTYPTLLKADGLAVKFKVSGLPTFYVLDAQGKIVWGSVLKPPPDQPKAGVKELREYVESQMSLIIDAELEKAIK